VANTKKRRTTNHIEWREQKKKKSIKTRGNQIPKSHAHQNKTNKKKTIHKRTQTFNNTITTKKTIKQTKKIPKKKKKDIQRSQTHITRQEKANQKTE